MITTIKVIGTGKPAANRRWLSAVMGAAAVIGASAVLTAPPAHADAFKQVCDTYHSWTECISYDYSNGNLAVNALNGYSVMETESVSIDVGGYTYDSRGFDIPPGSWRGYADYWGSSAPTDLVCGEIDSITVVCAVL